MWTIYNQTRIGYCFTTVLNSHTVFSYDGLVESEGETVNVHSDRDIDELINGYLGKQDANLDNTHYFSDRISLLLDIVKEKEEGKD